MIVPLNVALPSELNSIPPVLDPICIEVGVIVTLLSASFPIVTVVPDIVTRSLVSSFNFNELPVISTCSVEVLPTVVV